MRAAAAEERAQPRPGAARAPARHRARADPARHALQQGRRQVALGGEPDLLEVGERLLHAGRQDRVLHRHPGLAAADRRRGGHHHGPRDRPRAARARARAHVRAGAEERRHLGRPRRCSTWGRSRPSCWRRRPTSRSACPTRASRNRTRTWSAWSSPRAPATTRAPRSYGVAEDVEATRRAPGKRPAAAVPLHASVEREPHQGNRGQPAEGPAALQESVALSGDGRSFYSAGFYAGLPVLTEFSAVTDTANFAPLPARLARRDLRRAQLHPRGARPATTSTSTRSAPPRSPRCSMPPATLDIPFIFEGDGSAFCVPPQLLEDAKAALVKTQEMAQNSFGLELRVATLAGGDDPRGGPRHPGRARARVGELHPGGVRGRRHGLRRQVHEGSGHRAAVRSEARQRRRRAAAWRAWNAAGRTSPACTAKP